MLSSPISSGIILFPFTFIIPSSSIDFSSLLKDVRDTFKYSAQAVFVNGKIISTPFLMSSLRLFMQLADRISIIIEGSFYVRLIARSLFRTTRLSRGFLYTKRTPALRPELSCGTYSAGRNLTALLYYFTHSGCSAIYFLFLLRPIVSIGIVITMIPRYPQYP